MPVAPRDVPASVSLDALDMLSVYEGCKCRNVKEKYRGPVNDDGRKLGISKATSPEGPPAQSEARSGAAALVRELGQHPDWVINASRLLFLLLTKTPLFKYLEKRALSYSPP